jgi:adenylate kinase family enzyme
VNRVAVVGGSCSGKTRLARRLARQLGVTHVELDELHHGPNWTEASAEELRAKVCAALAAAPDGWVVDGNYGTKLGDLVLGQADTAVWLDPPFPTVIRRSLVRTLSRALFRTELWSGNRESFRLALCSRDSMILWVLRTHRGQRTKIPARLARNPQLDVVVLRSAREADRWLQSQATARTSGSSGSNRFQKVPPSVET